jgi:hypothetical protein
VGETLDYESLGGTEKIKTVQWWRRYLICGFIFGVCYLIAFFVTALASDDTDTNPIVDVLGPVFSFPLLGLAENLPFNDTGAFLGLLAGNTLFWGIAPVAIWHVIYTIRRWKSGRAAKEERG